MSRRTRIDMTAATNKSILLVEDEPSVAEICRIVLTDEGFKVHVAVNGRLPRDMIETRQYDLCLIDIRMPMMNGVELFQWLKEKDLATGKRVAFISGDVMGSTTQSFLEKAKRPFLPKPFAPEELKAFVNKLFRK